MTHTRARWKLLLDDAGGAALACAVAVACAVALSEAADGMAWILGRLP